MSRPQGSRHTPESRAKIRAAHLGMRPTAETIEKIRENKLQLEAGKRERRLREVEALGGLRCRSCLQVKRVDQFHGDRRGFLGKNSRCAACASALRTKPDPAKRREYEARPEVAAKRLISKANSREKEKRREAVNRYHRTPKGRARSRAYYEANREAYRRRARARRLTKPPSVSDIIRKRVSAQMRDQLCGRKAPGTFRYLDYTCAELAAHLERQFTKGMTWDRFRAGEIHIDHITPVSSFKIEAVGDPDFVACWSLPNLRPLWKAENMAKGQRRELLL